MQSHFPSIIWDLLSARSGSRTRVFCVLRPLLDPASPLGDLQYTPDHFSKTDFCLPSVWERRCLGTCRLQAVADLRVKPPIVAVAVMPVLCIILKPVREGVRALEDRQHAVALRKSCFPQEGQASRKEVAFSLPQKRSGTNHSCHGCGDGDPVLGPVPGTQHMTKCDLGQMTCSL